MLVSIQNHSEAHCSRPNWHVAPMCVGDTLYISASNETEKLNEKESNLILNKYSAFKNNILLL